jgi:hypothetical protein
MGHWALHSEGSRQQNKEKKQKDGHCADTREEGRALRRQTALAQKKKK